MAWVPDSTLKFGTWTTLSCHYTAETWCLTSQYSNVRKMFVNEKIICRMKDNPSKMREEFLLAAEKYMECELPSKAVICLQNSREWELAAHLYEKIGQVRGVNCHLLNSREWELAAHLYEKNERVIISTDVIVLQVFVKAVTLNLVFSLHHKDVKLDHDGREFILHTHHICEETLMIPGCDI